MDPSSAEIDPNQLWCSPFGDSNGNNSSSYRTTFPSRPGATDNILGELMTRSISLNVYEMPAVLEKLQLQVAKMWTKHKKTFSSFWSKMTIESRKNFIMDVSPCLCYADDDRYCVLDGRKVYERDAGGGNIETYDRLMSLVPYMNVCTLASGENDLEWLFEEVASWDLAQEASGLIVNFRHMYETQSDMEGRSFIRRSQDKLVPYTSFFQRSEKREYAKQKNLKKGDLIVLNFRKELAESQGIDKSFGALQKCNDPARTRGGANLDGGTLVEGTNARVNFWNMGLLSLPFENQEAIKALHFVLLNVGQWMDEFREEYLGRFGTQTLSTLSSCLNCDDQDPSVKKLVCSRCKVAFYCSKECQRAHWPAHKVACKMFTRNISANSAVGGEESV